RDNFRYEWEEYSAPPKICKGPIERYKCVNPRRPALFRANESTAHCADRRADHYPRPSYRRWPDLRIPCAGCSSSRWSCARRCDPCNPTGTTRPVHTSQGYSTSPRSALSVCPSLLATLPTHACLQSQSVCLLSSYHSCWFCPP